MSTDLAVRQSVALSTDQLKFISQTEFVPPGLRGNLPAILACVATGRELGIGDMAALKSIHIIDGKATFSAELMVQLVRRAGHSITGEVSAEQAKVTGTRADNGDTMTVVWTTVMAERAGLLNKSNWKKYTESMLWARAASQLCRQLFADCFAGGTYTPEELEDVEAPAPSWTQPEEEEMPVEAAPAVEFISEPQRKRLWAIANANGCDEDAMRTLVAYHTGQESTAQIPRSVYDKLIADVEAEGLPFG